jgi:DNA-binding protein H-NS
VSKYLELLEQKKALDAQIEAVRAQERAAVVDEIRQKMVDYQIDVKEIAPGKRGIGKSVKKPSSVAPKYRDPVSGKTWTGRGKPPRWLAGQPRERFLIEQ